MSESVGDLMGHGVRRLAGGERNADLEARVFFEHATGIARSVAFAFPERSVPDDSADRFNAMVSRRLTGEPVAYIVGIKEFWSLTLRVTPAVLIPRPETELLVETVLERLTPKQPAGLLELGTGSGAIALALKQERPALSLTATDLSVEALELARHNARSLGLVGIEFLAGNWYGPVGARRFNFVVSNPPYVEQSHSCLRHTDLRFEPRAALAAGVDGLDEIRKIIAGTGRHLLPAGWIVLEHGYEQGQAVRSILSKHGFRGAETVTDSNNRPRVTFARMD